MRIPGSVLAVLCFLGGAALLGLSVSLHGAWIGVQLFAMLLGVGDQVSKDIFRTSIRGSIPLPTGKVLLALGQEALKGAFSLFRKGGAALRQGSPYPASPKPSGGGGGGRAAGGGTQRPGGGGHAISSDPSPGPNISAGTPQGRLSARTVVRRRAGLLAALATGIVLLAAVVFLFWMHRQLVGG